MWFFFFQAEDGIRDSSVTGVQTCALPIYHPRSRRRRCAAGGRAARRGGRGWWPASPGNRGCPATTRSGERRVGEEGKYRGGPDPLKKKQTAQCSSARLYTSPDEPYRSYAS